MPHLTTPPGARLPGARAGGMGFGIPGYAHPLLAPVEWAELTRPGTPLHWAVLNVTDGPGGRPDPHCTEAAARLREAGGTVLGHLAMRNGKRSFGELVSDAHRFRDWYRVGGFYLADAPADRGNSKRCAGSWTPCGGSATGSGSSSGTAPTRTRATRTRPTSW